MPRLHALNRYNRHLISVLIGIGVLIWLALSPAPAIAQSIDDAEKSQQVMAMYADYREDFPGIEEIDPAAAIALVGDPNVVFVDVRDPEEQAVSMIPGAVPSEVFMAGLEHFRGQRIIGYCTISYRSGKLAAKLDREGMTMTNLEGGLLAWVHAGGPLVRGNRPVQEMHVYGRKWDMAPQAIETEY